MRTSDFLAAAAATEATHGENHFVIMIGGLHIEMAMLKLLGVWLEDKCIALVQAGQMTWCKLTLQVPE